MLVDDSPSSSIPGSSPPSLPPYRVSWYASPSRVVLRCHTFDWSPCTACFQSALPLPPRKSTCFAHSRVYRVPRLGIGLPYHLTWFPDATPLIGRRSALLVHSWQSPFFASSLSCPLVSTAMLLPLAWSPDVTHFIGRRVLLAFDPPYPSAPGNPPPSPIRSFIASHSWALAYTSSHVVFRCHTSDWSTSVRSSPIRSSLLHSWQSPSFLCSLSCLSVSTSILLALTCSLAAALLIGRLVLLAFDPPYLPPRKFTSFAHSRVYRILQLGIGLPCHLTWFSDATLLIGRRTFARLRPALPSFIPGNSPPSFVPYRVSR